MKKFFASVLFIIISMACKTNKNIASSSKKSAPHSQMGFVVLHNYAVNPSVLLTDSINYKYMVTAEEFNKTFHMTKASPGTAVVPDFSRQSVVAIILQPTEKVISIDIHKAETGDKDLNIFYTITDTAKWTTFSHTIKAIAAVPKNYIIKQVSFYKNDLKEKTILVND